MSRKATSTRSKSLDPAHLVGQLNIEWERLGDRAIPVDLSHLLPAARTLTEVDKRLPYLPDRTRDAVLHALLCGPTDSAAARRLAERAVVQMLLGQAIGSLRRGDREALGSAAAEQLAVTCLVEVVATYRVARAAVWVNLVCDTRRLIARCRAEERAVAHHEIPVASIERPVSGERRASEEMVRLLTWAVRTHALDQEAAALLARRYRRPDAIVGERPNGCGFFEDPAELASSLKLGRAAVRKRCSRAVRKLRAAVGDYALEEMAASAWR